MTPLFAKLNLGAHRTMSELTYQIRLNTFGPTDPLTH